MIRFHNRPNPEHRIGDKIVWESRSAAIVAVIAAQYDDDVYVLMEKRSSKMDQPGKWCLPCGYLDWDESGWDAMIREVYEETSLYIPDYLSTNLISKLEKCQEPFFVNTNPKENRQNVALSYGLYFDFSEGLPMEPVLFKNDEVDKVKWVKVQDLENYDIAFDHDKRVKMFMLY